MQEKTIRTHDKLYLKENRKDNPKEYFKFIINNTKEYIDKLDDPTVLDIGCATGDFLYYFNTIWPNAKKYGMDVMDDLLIKAREEVEGVIFFKGDIEDNGDLIDEKFDVIFMNGVHSIFDDIRLVLDNVIKLLKDNGRAYIFGIFNPEQLDVIIRTRKSNSNDDREKGWNLFSIETISAYLNEQGFSHNFKEFKTGINIDKNINDPLRSWTINLEGGEKAILNGLQLLHTFYLLEIQK